jgi:MFS family permease
MSNRNPLNFFAGYLLSAFGYEFVFFVMTVHVYNLTGSALDVGIFSSVSFVPRLFSPLYGLIADHYDRKKIFVSAAGMMALLIIAIAFVDRIVWIYPIWFVISIFAMMIMNVRTLIMTEIMQKEKNLKGNSAVLTILSLARIVAPFAGGIIAALWTPRSLLFLTSIIYLSAAAIIFGVRLEKRTGTGIRTVTTMLSDMKEGVTCITGDSSLRFLAVTGILWRLFLGLQISLFVVYVKSFFGLGNTAYGLFMTCIGLGSIAGSLFGPGIAKKIDASKLIVGGLGVHYLLFATLGIIHNFPIALATVFVSYALFYTTLVGIHSIRDRVTRVEIRGRVYGSITAILTPPGIVSMLLGGYLAGVYGAEKVILGAGILALAGLAATSLVFSKQQLVVPEGAPD